ncbi:hypothetical protein [Chromobacterium haemolyticum]|uniref:hypothetical protein n=1 Tax=Chromobacterium haemolyticum TaxID=394935 RepID=UPI001746CF90|nr:hypothetical protein [Chromobacterium haemolyticum]QOD81901.1 hypothetical protein IEZ30_18710 [Chromobacterium haemolyticum]
MKTIYHYDPSTGEYLYQGEADPSPLEEDVWLIPAHATELAPPAAGERQIAVFRGEAWQLNPDWRGLPLWSTVTGEPVVIADLGVTPADIGATNIERPPATVWDGAAWKEDPSLQAKHLAERFAAKLAEINAAVGRALGELSASYPAGEVSSWSQQTAEADALVANPAAPAPLLTAIATARGLSVTDLAGRVRAKRDAYAQSSGQIIGQRQALEDALGAIDLQAGDAAAKLEAIQWPAA